MLRHYAGRCLINSEIWMNKHPFLVLLFVAVLFCIAGYISGDNPR